MIAFTLLAPVMVVAALGLLFARKAVHCALLLAVVMISMAVLYAVLDAPFLFAVQIIVYTGAILMLFLFVLMLVGVDSSDSIVETIRGQRVWAGIVGLLFGLTLAAGVAQVALGPAVGLAKANEGGNVPSIAKILFSKYVLAFETTSLLLITAAVAAMVLAHRERLTAKIGQAERAAQRMRDFAEHGKPLGPLPSPGVFARHNAVDTPALLPDGTPADASVSRVLAARGDVRSAPAFADQIDMLSSGHVADEPPAALPAAPAVADDTDTTDSPAATDSSKSRAEATKAAEPGVAAAGVAPLADFEQGTWAGSVRARSDRARPEGYDVKGNANSMLFHRPGGRWYEVTVAEVWFDSAESAQAAGFTEAGKPKKKEGNR